MNKTFIDQLIPPQIFVTNIFSAITVMVQALFWLSTVWSCKAKCLFECIKSENIYQSTLLRVKPTPHNGDEELVKIRKRRKLNSARPQIWFQFQKVIFS
jgi:hypothetical protein